MKQAAVAAENRTFWTDKGNLDPRHDPRCLEDHPRGQDMQGGSTITQQYIKILYLNSDRTLTRKFRELILPTRSTKR